MGTSYSERDRARFLVNIYSGEINLSIFMCNCKLRAATGNSGACWTWLGVAIGTFDALFVALFLSDGWADISHGGYGSELRVGFLVVHASHPDGGIFEDGLVA
jgi:hypothetical protein